MTQIYPSTITGKGFAEGGSVLDHRFGSSEPYTLGVEEEYMLLDGTTFDLVQHIDTVLSDVAGHELESQIKAELMQSVIEIATPVCRTPAEAESALRQLRGYITSVAAERALRVGSAGTHPFSLFERQRITARDRYRQLVDQMQYVARRELIFGMHVHVAVDSPEKAIQVMNGLLLHLPQMLALSASSPFWRGEPTGLASTRQLVFAAFPLAAYCQALVKLYSERYDRGEEIPSYHRILTTENKWLAARYGLEAPVMDLATGRRNRVPVAQLVRRTLRELEPHARELGSERELDGVREILSRGNGADRQLRIFNANRDIVEVVSEIADATEVAAVPVSAH